jgi:hypothetical protein
VENQNAQENKYCGVSETHLKDTRPLNVNATPPVMTAMSIEFVAKPEQATKIQLEIPPAIARAFKDAPGFSGCLVMVPEQEARLVTVVMLWAGNDRIRRPAENTRRVIALLGPFVDRHLRAQTLAAHLPVLPVRPHATSTSESAAFQVVHPSREQVCVT